ELIRSTPEEKQAQIENVKSFQKVRNPLAGETAGMAAAAPSDVTESEPADRGNAESPGSLAALQNTARERKNIFERLMEAVKYNSLGQISHALYEVGGEYRRNM
ncbi:MAG: hypothetical protein ACRD4Q_14765, partial [Candidatus Acidiferrales bacterium]